MIKLENITKSFGRVRALGGVTFEVGEGEVVGLLGRNGAGKSTTMRIITGYLHQDAGRAWIRGIDTLERPREARRRIGYLPEAGGGHPEMSVEGYLRYHGALHGLGGKRLRGAVREAMERCDLTGVARRRTGHLSKGYRQRVGLASAILHDPPVLVLDEPSSGLDPAQARSMRGLVRELGSKATVMVSTHVLSEVEAMCDRVLVIAAGEVRADVRLAELRGRSSGPCLVQLPVRGRAELESRCAVLTAIPGVRRVSAADDAAPEGGWATFRVTPSDASADLREPIARAVQEAGLLMRELRTDRGTLEDLFMRVTGASEGEPARAETEEAACA